MASDEAKPDEPAYELPTRELVRELVAESERLVREQIRLAATEVRSASRKAAAAGVLLGAAAAIGITGLIVLACDATYLLAFVMPLWVSALVVGGGAATVASLLAYGAYHELRNAAEGSRRVVDEVKESGRSVKRALHEPSSTNAIA